MAISVRRRPGAQRQLQRREAFQPFSPFQQLEELQDLTQRLMESALSVPTEVAPFVPNVDIEETEDAWIVEAEVPGVRREDVDVEVRDDELRISGEIKERERQGILRRRTRRVGQFEFRVQLPGAVDPERMEANLDDGVLTVRIPKPEPHRARHVEIGSRAPAGDGGAAGAGGASGTAGTTGTAGTGAGAGTTGTSGTGAAGGATR
jgi:HSP20 family protein